MGVSRRWRVPHCQGGCGSSLDLSWLFAQGAPKCWVERKGGFMRQKWLRIPGFRDKKNALKWFWNSKIMKKHPKLDMLSCYFFIDFARGIASRALRDAEKESRLQEFQAECQARTREQGSCKSIFKNRGGNQFEQDLTGRNKKSHVANCY